jgi:hypothetical protein
MTGPINREDTVLYRGVHRDIETPIRCRVRRIDYDEDAKQPTYTLVPKEGHERTQFEARPKDVERVFGSVAEASAYLLAQSLSSYTAAKSRGRLVQCFFNDGGKNLSNESAAFDFDVGEIGPLEAYNDRVQADAPPWAVVYANFVVRGPRDPDEGGDGWEYGMPHYSSTPSGGHPKPLSDLDEWTAKACQRAGIDLTANRRADEDTEDIDE